MTDKQQEYEKIKQSIAGCGKCGLCEKRTNIVLGEGSLDASIMFVGEGPGRNEDLQGRPFVGQAGKLLDELLAAININRGDVYIANVVKCRPPNNRDPKPEEIETCLPYLREQVKLIKPKLIATLGRHALKTLVAPELDISKSHGTVFKKGQARFFALYHPAAALYNPDLKKVLMQDFKKMEKAIENFRL